MRRFSDVEASWNRKIDITDQKALDLGRRGEEAVIKFFQNLSSRVEVRRATPKEDAGPDAVFGAKTIDLVLYDKHTKEPVFAPQVSVSRSPKIHKEKFGWFMNHPFIRLEEQGKGGIAVPTGLIIPDQEDIEKQRPIGKKVIEDTLKSLSYDLTQTKNPTEIAKVQNWINIFEETKLELEAKEKSGPN